MKKEFINKESYLERVKALNDPYWNSSSEKRWEYMAPVLAELKLINPRNAIELGSNGVYLMNFSDHMELKIENISMDNSQIAYLGDVRETPWRIPDKCYDVFVALQVLEHLGPKQREVFGEISRIARYCIITLPYKWKKVSEDNCHYMIDEDKINAWTDNLTPYKVEKFGNRIMLCYKFQ